MFSPEYYAQLDPGYQKALHILEPRLKDSKHPNVQYALIDFAGQYMVTQELWSLLINKNKTMYLSTSDSTRNTVLDDQIRSTCAAFYFKLCPAQLTATKYYDSNLPRWAPPYVFVLPHKDLDLKMARAEPCTYAFIPPKIRQRHEEMKALYVKIKEAEDDVDGWFAALLEAKNHQFVKDNVEYRLGNNMTNKKLWKRYIDYLKKRDNQILLQTYSKYCRFFIDDTEMLEEYRQAAAKQYRRVYVPWKNPFSFETHDKNFWKREAKIRHRLFVKNFPPESEPLTIHFDAKNPARPQFPFLPPTIRHILDNASGDVLQKLFKTCKWFRIAQPINVCYKFLESNDANYIELNQEEPLKFIENSIKSFNNAFSTTTNIGKLYISTVFLFCCDKPNALSDLMPRIYRSTVKYVDIRNQRLSWDELKFLIGHGNVIDLCLYNVKDSDENLFTLEDILQLTPKIKRFWLSQVQCTADSFQKLTEFEFQNKLDRICFFDVNPNLLDPVKFVEFVKKNCASNAYIELNINEDNWNTQFYEILVDAVNEIWKEKIGKPILRYFLLKTDSMKFSKNAVTAKKSFFQKCFPRFRPCLRRWERRFSLLDSAFLRICVMSKLKIPYFSSPYNLETFQDVVDIPGPI